MKFIWRSYYQFLLVWKQSRLYFLRTSWYDAVLAISRHLKWSDILLSKLLITTAPFFCNHFGTLILRTYTRISEPFLLHLNSILGYNLGDSAYGYSKLTAFRGRLLRATQPAHAEHRCVLECKLGKMRHSFFFLDLQRVNNVGQCSNFRTSTSRPILARPSWPGDRKTTSCTVVATIQHDTQDKLSTTHIRDKINVKIRGENATHTSLSEASLMV